MSIWTTAIGKAAGGFASGGISGAIVSGVSSLFGGDGGPNIANSLSAQVGCTILQKDANAARALIKQGIDPCTGAAAGQVPGGGTLFPEFGGPPAPAIPGVTAPTMVPRPGGPAGAMVATQAGALEFTSTGLIRSVIVNGRRVSRKAAASLIRRQGIEIGARALGLSLTQAAQVVLAQSSRPRRRRGISGRQITEARRVIRVLGSFQKQLGTTRRAPARRKTSCR